MNIFAPESMSDLSHTQTVSHMRPFKAAQDCRHNHAPIWELAARNNKKPTTRIYRENGKLINRVETY